MYSGPDSGLKTDKEFKAMFGISDDKALVPAKTGFECGLNFAVSQMIACHKAGKVFNRHLDDESAEAKPFANRTESRTGLSQLRHNHSSLTSAPVAQPTSAQSSSKGFDSDAFVKAALEQASEAQASADEIPAQQTDFWRNIQSALSAVMQKRNQPTDEPPPIEAVEEPTPSWREDRLNFFIKEALRRQLRFLHVHVLHSMATTLRVCPLCQVRLELDQVFLDLVLEVERLCRALAQHMRSSDHTRRAASAGAGWMPYEARLHRLIFLVNPRLSNSTANFLPNFKLDDLTAVTRELEYFIESTNNTYLTSDLTVRVRPHMEFCRICPKLPTKEKHPLEAIKALCLLRLEHLDFPVHTGKIRNMPPDMRRSYLRMEEKLMRLAAFFRPDLLGRIDRVLGEHWRHGILNALPPTAAQAGRLQDLMSPQFGQSQSQQRARPPFQQSAQHEPSPRPYYYQALAPPRGLTPTPYQQPPQASHDFGQMQQPRGPAMGSLFQQAVAARAPPPVSSPPAPASAPALLPEPVPEKAEEESDDKPIVFREVPVGSGPVQARLSATITFDQGFDVEETEMVAQQPTSADIDSLTAAEEASKNIVFDRKALNFQGSEFLKVAEVHLDNLSSGMRDDFDILKAIFLERLEERSSVSDKPDIRQLFSLCKLCNADVCGMEEAPQPVSADLSLGNLAAVAWSHMSHEQHLKTLSTLPEPEQKAWFWFSEGLQIAVTMVCPPIAEENSLKYYNHRRSLIQLSLIMDAFNLRSAVEQSTESLLFPFFNRCPVCSRHDVFQVEEKTEGDEEETNLAVIARKMVNHICDEDIHRIKLNTMCPPLRELYIRFEYYLFNVARYIMAEDQPIVDRIGFQLENKIDFSLPNQFSRELREEIMSGEKDPKSQNFGARPNFIKDTKSALNDIEIFIGKFLSDPYACFEDCKLVLGYCLVCAEATHHSDFVRGIGLQQLPFMASEMFWHLMRSPQHSHMLAKLESFELRLWRAFQARLLHLIYTLSPHVQFNYLDYFSVNMNQPERFDTSLRTLKLCVIKVATQGMSQDAANTLLPYFTFCRLCRFELDRKPSFDEQVRDFFLHRGHKIHIGKARNLPEHLSFGGKYNSGGITDPFRQFIEWDLYLSYALVYCHLGLLHRVHFLADNKYIQRLIFGSYIEVGQLKIEMPLALNRLDQMVKQGPTNPITFQQIRAISDAVSKCKICCTSVPIPEMPGMQRQLQPGETVTDGLKELCYTSYQHLVSPDHLNERGFYMNSFCVDAAEIFLHETETAIAIGWLYPSLGRNLSSLVDQQIPFFRMQGKQLQEFLENADLDELLGGPTSVFNRNYVLPVSSKFSQHSGLGKRESEQPAAKFFWTAIMLKSNVPANAVNALMR